MFIQPMLNALDDPIPGKPQDSKPADDLDNFYTCPTQSAANIRDLRQVIWHEQPKHKPLLSL
ncbi:hypothetical protein X742_33200 [Mesorhizobium sp. LNHC232B00]|nr:hypothetical protein X742_33200 [Mesorhizobium sp. LNHC232B00]